MAKRETVQRGMTLVEIMVVVTIIGAVMAAVGFYAIPMLNKGNCKAAYIMLQKISGAVDMYKTENSGDCPKSLDELMTGKFLQKQDSVDPWGQPYNFKCPGDKNTDGADIWSKGRNKQDGDEDDVRSWLGQNEQCKK